MAYGPWKFGGITGFIMAVNDANNHYSFTFVDEQRMSRTEPVAAPILELAFMLDVVLV